ncbi:MAG: DUF98 domain-containing protein [Chloroflexales bacterium]|nr:DUF98 domain-containing protein [Chloroflexales bacterium]
MAPPAVETQREPAVFVPLADLMSERAGRPEHLHHIDLRSLTSFQRALLAIDGTVTKFIEAYTLEPVDVSRLRQETCQLAGPHLVLETSPGVEVVAREVLLRGKYSSIVYAYAVSLLVPGRLPSDALDRLQTEPGGLGRVLTSGAIENRRELLWYGREHLPELPATVRQHTGELFLSRTYRIFIGGLPAMLINEKFPMSLADRIAGDEDG